MPWLRWLTCKEHNPSILNTKSHKVDNWSTEIKMQRSLHFTQTFCFWVCSHFKQNFVKLTFFWLCIGSLGCFPVKSPNDFIAEVPSNPILNLPFKEIACDVICIIYVPVSVKQCAHTHVPVHFRQQSMCILLGYLPMCKYSSCLIREFCSTCVFNYRWNK